MLLRRSGGLGTISRRQLYASAHSEGHLERYRENGKRQGLVDLAEEVSSCRRCPRLVEWREQVARERRAAFAQEQYWGRPLPGFGDPAARLLVFGLAPAAHGANRTGRMFTGDRSGDFLFAALFRAGFANQPTSVARDDGLRLRGAWISAAVRCAPPANRPTPAEREQCLPWSVRELQLLGGVRTILCLGAFAWDAALRLTAALADPPAALPRPRPRVRPRGRVSGGSLHAARLLPPEPAEHVHGQAHRADDRRGAGARARARRGRLAGALALELCAGTWQVRRES